MKQMKFSVPLFMSHGHREPQIHRAGRRRRRGVVFPAGKLLVADTLAASDPQKQVLLDYAQAFTGMYPGQDPGHLSGAMPGMPCRFVVQALRPPAAPTRPKLQRWIESTKGYVGISGHLQPQPHRPQRA